MSKKKKLLNFFRLFWRFGRNAENALVDICVNTPILCAENKSSITYI